MYRVTSGIHIHFAHHVRGHSGPCISLHGHTWKFELTLEAETLDAEGFVVDFDLVHQQVLMPCHLLLDHSLALGEQSYAENRTHLEAIGKNLVATRCETIGDLGQAPAMREAPLGGARNESPGGIKLAVFPFSPTSERLAEWLYGVAMTEVGDARVGVASTRILETLHPSECVAEYLPAR